MESSLKEKFHSIWKNSDPRIFISPARINIIGEHVDYLGGLVLPAAIHFVTEIAIAKNDLNKFRIHSVQFNESVEIEKLEYQKEKKWVNYVLGVLDEIKKEGFEFSGVDIVIDGNIPHGAGLSSSASLEVGIGYAISEIFELGLSREKIAIIGQRAENNFVGAKCGIMDQFVIATGKKDFCVLL
ncbi:MAG: galactokinase, partial [Leptospiraceae bacterium]|nr:galactokinase [Leptospiraceae bacterium]